MCIHPSVDANNQCCVVSYNNITVCVAKKGLAKVNFNSIFVYSRILEVRMCIVICYLFNTHSHGLTYYPR